MGIQGIGPAKMQIGDVVCVFIDGDVPFVVHREKASFGAGCFRKWQHEKYYLVGEAYIYGMVDGGW